MKRAVAVIAAFAIVALLTVAAQAGVKGEQIFSQKCAMCHVVKGKGGTVGPELTKIASKMKEADVKAKLENPKTSNPKSLMPSFKTLSKAEMDALITYLMTLK